MTSTGSLSKYTQNYVLFGIPEIPFVTLNIQRVSGMFAQGVSLCY